MYTKQIRLPKKRVLAAAVLVLAVFLAAVVFRFETKSRKAISGESVTESYNLYAYYEFAKSENDAALIGIVEGLMKYSLGAKAYRDSVIAVK